MAEEVTERRRPWSRDGSDAELMRFRAWMPSIRFGAFLLMAPKLALFR